MLAPLLACKRNPIWIGSALGDYEENSPDFIPGDLFRVTQNISMKAEISMCIFSLY